jgi:hypothetical protein
MICTLIDKMTKIFKIMFIKISMIIIFYSDHDIIINTYFCYKE